MTNLNAPLYYARIVKRDGTYVGGTLESSGAVLPAPLPVDDIQFTDVAPVPNQPQSGSFTLKLKDTDAFPNLRSLYSDIDYFQRVEIFPNSKFLGDPAYTGVVHQLPKDLKSNQVRGSGIISRLEEQRVRRQERLTGDSAFFVREILKTYQDLFMDDFNRTTGLGANWTVTSGTWDIVNNVLVNTGGLTPYVQTTAVYNATQWGKARAAFRYRRTGIGNNSGCRFPYQDVNNSIVLGIGYDWGNETEYIVIGQYVGGVYTPLGTRYIPLVEQDTWSHVDIVSKTEGTGRRIIVSINGVEVFNVLSTGTAAFTGNFQFEGSVADYDDFILIQHEDALTPGDIIATGSTIDQPFRRDTNKTVLDWLVNHDNWQYRVNPKTGEGNDTIDIGTDIGINWSGTLVLEEGKNIENLQVDRSADDLATWVDVQGQANDDATLNGFVSVNIDSIETYGLIETSISDQHVVDNATAKVVGDAYLAQVLAAKESVSCRVIDESFLYRQKPMYGYAIFGDAIWDGRTRLRAGDSVPVISRKCFGDLQARLKRIVAITRHRNDPGIELVFDAFRYDRPTELQRTNQQLMLMVRSWMERANSLTKEFIFGAANTLTWSPRLFGIIERVLLTVRSDAWGGTSLAVLEIDGVDVTAALGGPWVDDLTVDVTAYLPRSGDYTIELTTDGAVIFDCQLLTRLLG